MPQDRYQTVREVTDRLEVAEATVRQWIKTGTLRAIEIGKGWRIADTDLALIMIAHETAPRDVPFGQSEMTEQAFELPTVGHGEGIR